MEYKLESAEVKKTTTHLCVGRGIKKLVVPVVRVLWAALLRVLLKYKLDCLVVKSSE